MTDPWMDTVFSGGLFVTVGALVLAGVISTLDDENRFVTLQITLVGAAIIGGGILFLVGNFLVLVSEYGLVGMLMLGFVIYLLIGWLRG